jgi:3-oxoacyl-[acyl-carrier protein] reductase
MTLEGRAALVTGASRGIGRGIALTLAKYGAPVACLATTENSAKPTAEEIVAHGGKAIALGCDIGDPGQAEKAVETALSEFGEIQILVNNAGITKDQLILRMTENDWDEVIRVNLKGTYNMIKAVSKPMLKQRSGRIINISSIIGLTGQAGQANYAAAKAGIIGLTKSVAKEFGARGITCNAIAPGFIETEMTERLPEDMRNRVLETTPLGRLGSPEDVAGAVAFLASELAGFITGQVLTVDGGLTV